MLLSSHHAQRIVEDMYHIANYNFIFTNDQGVIIASVDKSRIGDLHEGAVQVLRTREKVVITSPNQYRGARVGIIYPIFVNKQVVGVIGITGTEQEVGAIGEIVRRVVEMLVKESYMEKQAELEHVARESFVQDWLLHKQDDEHAFSSRGLLLGINIMLPRIVGVFKVKMKDAFTEEQANQELLLQKTKSKMIRKVKEMMIAPEYDLIAPLGSSKYAILFTRNGNMSEQDIMNRIASFAETLQQWIGAELNCTLSCGIGSCHDGMDGIRQSYREGKKALYFSEKQQHHSIVCYDDLRLERLIYDLPLQSRQEYMTGILKLSVLPDPEQAVETLDCLFKCNHSITEAASRLHIHKNTVQYRLNKIKELTGFDPRSFEDAAALYLAVRLYKLERKL